MENQLAKKSMENQLAIRCRRCGQKANTTNKARVFRCARCSNEIPVQTGHETQPRPQNGGSSSRNLILTTQPKCMPYNAWKSGVFPTDGQMSPAVGPTKETPAVRRRALVCGVSYKNQKFKLSGTIGDAYRMRDFLVRRYGFRLNDICMLTDDSVNRSPTKKNMEKGLRWLVEGCRAGDSLVFYFSGHGIHQIDNANDEIDGLDESLCPVDFSTEGIILDNDLNAILVRPLPSGVTLHAVVDACHSGTILDLPWVYDPKGMTWLDNRPPSGAYKGTSGGLAISFCACRDNQMAADTSAFSKKGMTGAMTSCLIQAVESSNFDLSYHQLVVAMQQAIDKSRLTRCRLLDKVLNRKFIYQEPLLSSSTVDVHQRNFKL